MLRFSTIIVALVFFPSLVFATGSGTTIGLSPNERVRRTDGFYAQMLQAKKTEAAYRESLRKFQTDFADARRACRADLRRANRDTKFPILVRCLRTETTIQRDFAKTHLEVINATPGITLPIRKSALRAFYAWIEALEAVIAGIDAGIYTLEDDLHETKQNLLTRYYQPLLQSLILLRGDRALSWTAFVYSRLEETTNTSPDPGWDAVRMCLETGEQQLLDIPTASVEDRKALLLTAFVHLQNCIAQIQTL